MKLTIPYYLHKAGAGFPSPATDYIEEDIDLNMHLIRNVPATFIIRVQGKSMVDVGINDGDLLVVDKSLKPKNFSTVIANVHDELVVKTLVQERDKKEVSEETLPKDRKIKTKKTKTDPNLFLFSDVVEETSTDNPPVQNEGAEISDITEINAENELLDDIDTPSYLRKGSNQ